MASVSMINQGQETSGSASISPDQAANQQLQRDAQGVLDLVENLGRGLERIRAAQARTARLRLPAFAILTLLQAAGNQGLTVSDAAMRLGVRPQALSTPVAELAKEGLLLREVDLTDARARRLYITESGVGRLDTSSPIREKLLREMLVKLPAPNVALLVLTRLESAIAQTLGQE